MELDEEEDPEAEDGKQQREADRKPHLDRDVEGSTAFCREVIIDQGQDNDGRDEREEVILSLRRGAFVAFIGRFKAEECSLFLEAQTRRSPV